MPNDVVRVRVETQSVSPHVGVKDGLAVADAAKRLFTPREIALRGSAQGGASFDGSEDIQIYTELETLTNADLEEMLK